jgi:hypothetical protein
MSNKPQKTIFSNEGSVIMFVDESVGVTNTTRRPLAGEELRRAKELVAKMEEWRRQAEEEAKKNEKAGNPPPKPDDGVIRLD